MKKHAHAIVVCVPIQNFPPDEPENKDPNGKRYAVVSITGRMLRLPRSMMQFVPGHVVIPSWLAKKVLKPEELEVSP